MGTTVVTPGRRPLDTSDPSATPPPRRPLGPVLLAVADPAARAAILGAIRARGFAVLEASDAAEAGAWVDSRVFRISLAVVDGTMPRFGGREAAGRVGGRAGPAVLALGKRIDAGDHSPRAPYGMGALLAAVAEAAARRGEAEGPGGEGSGG